MIMGFGKALLCVGSGALCIATCGIATPFVAPALVGAGVAAGVAAVGKGSSNDERVSNREAQKKLNEYNDR